jgi:hypothetical protein
MLNDLLKDRYKEILSCHSEFITAKYRSNDETYNHLSGIFLPKVHAEYSNSKNKVMIIGRETKGWKDPGKDSFESIDNYVQKAMKIHNDAFLEQLNEKNPKGCTFLNFLRAIADKAGGQGIVWANLFCIAHKKSIPSNSKHFGQIKELSKKLLMAQIEILNPDILIFANGISTAPHRRDFFPLENCIHSKDFIEVDSKITNHYLWQFDLKGKNRNYLSFRLHHPSAYSEKAIYARKFFLEKVLPGRLI